MNAREDVLAHYALVDHDGILKVVSLPRHKCNQQVAAERELSALSGVAFAQNLSALYTLPLHHNRAQVDGSRLVGLQKLNKRVGLGSRVETHQFLVFGTVVLDYNLVGIYVAHGAGALCVD